MLYYDKEIFEKFPDYKRYFQTNNGEHTPNCIILWGGDIKNQCAIALEIARILNCSENGNSNCNCLNCRWIREQTHPAVKIYTRLDFKDGENTSSDDEDSTSGKKNITVSQAKSIINELSISSDYHRVYILCDRDEDGNLLPLNQINFPEKTSNALLKTFEEPPSNTTFIFLTKDKNDLISTVVSRAQSFFVPSFIQQDEGFELVEDFIKNYWTTDRNEVLEFEQKLMDLIADNDMYKVLSQIQNYILAVMKENFNNKTLYYRMLKDLGCVEEAIRQNSLTPAMNSLTIIENLSFKLIL